MSEITRPIPMKYFRFADVDSEITHTAINSLIFPFMFIDSSHRILMANDASSSYLNLPIEKLAGHTCPRLHKEKYCIYCPLDQVIETNKSEMREVYDEIMNKWFAAMVFPVPFITDDNQSIYILNVLDITDKKFAESNLIHEKVQSTTLAGNYLQVIQNMLELRDPSISKHHKSVSLLAFAIAVDLGLDRDMIEGLRIAALIHDIGKISVPAEILSRPGKLSPLEYSYVQKHPVFGRDLIAPVSFPWPVGEIIYQHHERMNGSGYPEGITSDKIRLEAKIISVAEVVDSMTSHQTYRPAYGIKDTLKETENNRGTLYAPEVVDACLRLFREKGFTFAK